MFRTLWIAIVFLMFFGFAGCGMSDDERCGDDDYVFIDSKCVVPPDSDSDPEPIPVDSDTGDSESSGEIDGFGLECVDSTDCEGHLADYCATMPGDTMGACVVSNCATDPDDCPDPLLCCDLSGVGLPSMCLPEDQYNEYAAVCGGA